tara:strand:- start:1786 stop:2169 length:384 start_codon:yes stop_codon:yes gene_type:complete
VTEHTVTDEGARARVVDLILALNLERTWTIEIKRKVKRRTLSQNSLMWMWHDVVAKETGHDVEDIHEIIKDKFLVPKMRYFNEEEVGVRSTKKLTTIEMKNFMDAYYAFCVSELGIMLPIPEELGVR